jgi:photoactive yellow protein
VSTVFEEIDLHALASMPLEQVDSLPFGVVGLDAASMVVVYNEAEARMAGLDRDSVIGVPFFDAVAQCMNGPRRAAELHPYRTVRQYGGGSAKG